MTATSRVFRRILGVFDADSGEPIVAADVTAVAIGTDTVPLTLVLHRNHE